MFYNELETKAVGGISVSLSHFLCLILCVCVRPCLRLHLGVGVVMATALCVCTDEREGPHVQLIKGREKGRVTFFLTVSNRSHDYISADTGSEILACVYESEREIWWE